MMRALSLLVLISVFALSCKDEQENYLEGSLVDELSVEYDTIRARLYKSELAIDYMEDAKRNLVALRVTVDRSSAKEPQQGKAYDLKKQGSVTLPTQDKALPEMKDGVLQLEEFSLKNGSTASGIFRATFKTEDNNTLSLRGGFSADLEVVDPPE